MNARQGGRITFWVAMVDADAKRKVARGLLGISDLPPIVVHFFMTYWWHLITFYGLVAKIRRASVLRSNIAALCSPKSVDVETQELQGKKAAIMEKKARAQGPKDLAMRWETQGTAGNEGWHSLILVDSWLTPRGLGDFGCSTQEIAESSKTCV